MTQAAILQQSTFSTGEVSPSLYGRVDLQRYSSSLRRLKNMFVKAEGGVSKRPGTRFVAPTKDAQTVNLVPFQPTNTDGYMIEFGDQYARFYLNGNMQMDDSSAETTTGITDGSPNAVFAASGHSLVDGDQVLVTDNDGVNLLKDRFCEVVNVIAGVSFELKNWETPDAVLYDATMSGATITVKKPYEIETPYLAADVADLSYAQSVDVLYIANSNYPPQKLQRTSLSPLTFELVPVKFDQRLIKARVGAAGWTPGVGFPNGYASESYVVTYVDRVGESGLAESLPSDPFTGTRDASWADSLTASWIEVSVNKATSLVDDRATHIRFYKRSGSQYVLLAERPIPATAASVVFEDRNLTPVSTTTPPSSRNPFAKRVEYSGAAGATGGPLPGDYVFTPDFALSTITKSGTATDPVEVVTASHGLTPGLELDIFLTPVGLGNSNMSYRVFRALVVDGTTFRLLDLPSGDITAGGGALASSYVSLKVGVASEVVDANLATGTIYITELLGSFEDADQIATISSSLAAISGIHYSMGSGTPGTLSNVSQSFPSTVAFFEDRLVWAATDLAPQTVWTSQSGDYENLSVSDGIVPSDAVTFTINSRQLNKINSMVALDDLILMTSGAVWSASGAGDNEPIAPDNIKVRVQSYAGAENVPPVVLDDSVLFIESKSQSVRDLNYEFTADRYTGNDLTVMSRHLVEDYDLIDWCTQKVPHGLIWVVRDDGVVLSMTYLKEHDVRGWAQHEFGDGVSSIGSVSGLQKDDVYMVVTRGARRHIEFLQDRRYGSDINDAWFVDDGLSASFSGKSVWGLWHLEGETLSALVDGDVEENLVVSNGAVTLTNAATSKVIIGKPFTGELTTLDLNVDAQGGALAAQRRRISKIFVRVFDTRGLFAAEDGSSPLNELKQRKLVYDNAFSASDTEGVFEIVPAADWSRNGRVHLEFPYPLPAEITSIMPQMTVGG